MDFKLDFTDLQEQAKNGVFNLISALSAISPILLVLSMLALFVSLGYFQYVHFSETMTQSAMAVTGAVLYQLIRFGTALASIRLFSAKAYFRGALSLAASFTLTYLEAGMVAETATAISTTMEGAVMVNAWLIGIFVWLSFALEVFVSITTNAMFEERTATASPTPSDRYKAEMAALKRQIKELDNTNTDWAMELAKANNELEILRREREKEPAMSLGNMNGHGPH